MQSNLQNTAGDMVGHRNQIFGDQGWTNHDENWCKLIHSMDDMPCWTGPFVGHSWDYFLDNDEIVLGTIPPIKQCVIVQWSWGVPLKHSAEAFRSWLGGLRRPCGGLRMSLGPQLSKTKRDLSRIQRLALISGNAYRQRTKASSNIGSFKFIISIPDWTGPRLANAHASWYYAWRAWI